MTAQLTADGSAAPIKEFVLPSDYVVIQGAVSLDIQDQGIQPWRLPPEDLLLHHPSLSGPAACGAGVRLRLRTDAEVIRFKLARSDESLSPPGLLPGTGLADLVIDGRRMRTQPVSASGELAFADLPGHPKDVELWLPVVPPFRLVSVSISADASMVRPTDTQDPVWVVYGSSITHGTNVSPTRAWPMAAARLLSRNLYCLGFDDGCHLDPLVAETMADLPADFITMEVGINIFLSGSFSMRTLQPALHGFLHTIRKARPTIPIQVISPFLSPRCGDTDDIEVRARHATAFTDRYPSLADIRTAISDVITVRRSRPDVHLRYVDGRSLLDDPKLLPDGLHPNDQGHLTIARRLSIIQ